MQNGQGGGSTETGVYPLDGAVSGIISKSAGATVWIPSVSEWYKAAYYDPNNFGVLRMAAAVCWIASHPRRGRRILAHRPRNPAIYPGAPSRLPSAEVGPILGDVIDLW